MNFEFKMRTEMNEAEQKTNAVMQGFLAVMVIFLVLICVMLGIDLVRRYFNRSPFLFWPQFLVQSCQRSDVVDIVDQPDGPGGQHIDKTRTIFTIDADYVVLTYAFTDGLDLDTRTRVIAPDIGQDDQSHIGWGQKSQFPVGNPIPILEWGGDNRGTGVESVKIDLTSIRKEKPSANELSIDCRAFWYGTLGQNNVKIEAVFYKGGKMIPDGGFSFSNPSAKETSSLASTSVKIQAECTPSDSDEIKKRSPGQRVCTFQYDLRTGKGQLDTSDPTSP